MFSSDGKGAEVAGSDAELKAQSFAAIVQLLLSAGYFRARLTALSEFDRVVGGLCWAIVGSGVGVDVDLFFQENSTIGQRIKLSENIIKALRGMKCPSPLQAHQIQGSDFPSLLPVIKWLVKSVIKTREVTGDLVRMFSELLFKKGLGVLPGESSPGKSAFMGQVALRYKPQRRFKRSLDLITSLPSEEARVHSCLLEYGEKVSSRSEADGGGEGGAGGNSGVNEESGSGGGGAGKDGKGLTRRGSGGAGGRLAGFDRQYAAAEKAAQQEEEARRQRAQERQGEMLQQMATANTSATSSGRQVAGIVGLGSDAIRTAAAAYSEQSAALAEAEGARGQGGGAPLTKRGRAAAHKRQTAALKRRGKAASAKADVAQTALDVVLARLAAAQKELAEAEAYNARLHGEIAKLEELESQTEFKSDLGRLKHLVQLNESLRGQEKAFKASCKEQLEELNASLAALQGSDDSEETARLREIEEMHAELEAKYNKLRALLAKRNQAVALVSRQIDDVPTRTELIQYERRFVELYEEVALKLDENRRHVSTYNTLEETYGLLEKEVSLIQSVNDSFQGAMKSKSGKDQFLEQMRGILESLQVNLRQMRAKRDASYAERDLKQDEYSKLVVRQRKYFKAVKEFQEECDKNEYLSQKLAAKQ